MLDLCFVNDTDIITEITTRLGSSDHLCLELELSIPISSSIPVSKQRNFYKGDYETANQKLSHISLSCMENMDIEDSWAFFSETVKEIVNDTVPLHTNTSKKPEPPWMDNYCLKLVQLKYKAWKCYSFFQKSYRLPGLLSNKK